MRTIILFLIVTVLLISTAHGAGTTYYVKDGGSDGADGLSWENAWATIAKVNTSIASGDTVYFGTGIPSDLTVTALEESTLYYFKDKRP